jgi:ATP-dependent DNA helicase PIF1
MHTVAFKADDNLKDVDKPSSLRTMLIEYFEMNRKNADARKILYRDFLEHFRWDASKKRWYERKQRP